MIPWLEVLCLLLLLAGLGFWLDSFKTRAAAMRSARIACAAEGLLLLDDTVALASLRLQRDDEGRLRWRRVYQFEFSSTGDNRCDGYTILLGDELLVLHLSDARSGAARIVSCRSGAVE